MLVSTITGEAWTKHLKARDEAAKKQDEARKKGLGHEQTAAEARKQASDLGADLETRRRNAQKLIQAGCRVTAGTDSYWGAAPELAREPKPENQDHGIGTIVAIEGLVELGMTPSQAIVAATKNGAIACRKLDRVRHDRGGQAGRPGGARRRPAGRHPQSPQGRESHERGPMDRYCTPA